MNMEGKERIQANAKNKCIEKTRIRNMYRRIQIFVEIHLMHIRVSLILYRISIFIYLEIGENETISSNFIILQQAFSKYYNKIIEKIIFKEKNLITI